ncbi:MAG: hypothetical protein Q8Q10_02600, partial [bacterium]|nr:hypothetical protein [bacterium]
MKRIILMLSLSLAIFTNTAAGAAELDYQKLIGSWEWGYPIGFTVVIIRSVTVDEGGKVVLKGIYRVCPPICDKTQKGLLINGTIDPQREKNEIAFVVG